MSIIDKAKKITLPKPPSRHQFCLEDLTRVSLGNGMIGYSWPNGQGMYLEHPTSEQMEELKNWMLCHPEISGEDAWT